MKKKLLRIGLVLLFLISLALIFNRDIKYFVISRLTDNKVSQVTKSNIAKGNKSKGDFDFSKVGSITAGQVAKAATTQSDVAVLGKISIPDVNLYLPVVKGLSDAALATGASTMKATQKMGVGNYALAGHYMVKHTWGWNVLFSPVSKTKIGQKIYLTDLDNVYVYRIISKKVVAPTAVSVIDDVSGKKLITLITCADNGKNRWSVQGELISKDKATTKNLTVFK